MTNDEKLDAIQGVMDGAAMIGGILIGSDNEAALGDLAMSALAVIEEILNGKYSPLTDDVA